MKTVALLILPLTSASKLAFPSAAKPSLPSPFVIAACVVGLVALFGGLLSLYFERRRLKRLRGRAVERFWAIDSYACWFLREMAV